MDDFAAPPAVLRACNAPPSIPGPRHTGGSEEHVNIETLPESVLVNTHSVHSENDPPTACAPIADSSRPSERSCAEEKAERQNEKPIHSSKRPPPEDEEQSPQGCVICWEPISSSGSHTAAALRCGHVFGSACIRTYLSCSDRKRPECPNCRKPAIASEIVPLFIDSFVVADTRERDKLAQELRDANAARAHDRTQILQMQLMLARYGVAEASGALDRSPAHSSDHADAIDAPSTLFDDLGMLRFVRAVALPRDLAGRCAAYSEALGVFALGCNTSSSAAILKVSLLDRTHTAVVRGVHAGSTPAASQMRAIVAGSPRGAYAHSVLSTGSDSRLVLSSLATDSAQASIALPAQGYACAFDPVNEHGVFAALANGSVTAWDLRATARPLLTLALPTPTGATLPIHSLVVLPWDALGASIANVPRDRLVLAAGATFAAAVRLDACSMATADMAYAPSHGAGHICALSADTLPDSAGAMALLNLRGPHRHAVLQLSASPALLWTTCHTESAQVYGASTLPLAMRGDIFGAGSRYAVALPGAGGVRLRSLLRPGGVPVPETRASCTKDDLDALMDVSDLLQPAQSVAAIFGRRPSSVRPAVLGVLCESSFSVYA